MLRRKGIKHYLGIIVSEIDGHPELTRYLKQYKREFEFCIHGWEHDDYSEWDEKRIYEDLLKAKTKINTTFGIYPKIFFPPYNKTSLAVFNACERVGLECKHEWMPPEGWLGRNQGVICFHYWCQPEVNALKKIL